MATMKKTTSTLIIFAIIAVMTWMLLNQKKQNAASTVKPQEKHWLLLHRKSNKEYLFLGEPGIKEKSKIIKEFIVKTGIPGERPTPLPKLLGRDYWVIVNKLNSSDNPETAPYFLTLNIPTKDLEPYGPEPYTECNGQCNWSLLGDFGLHGVNGDESRLSTDNPGSSGCVRHKDSDISFLYNLLDPNDYEIRYYIEDI